MSATSSERSGRRARDKRLVDGDAKCADLLRWSDSRPSTTILLAPGHAYRMGALPSQVTSV